MVGVIFHKAKPFSRCMRMAVNDNISNFRQFSVKALPWCEPTDSPVRRSRKSLPEQDDKPMNDLLIPINRFGVVAAMSKNRVIGINGGIPWRAPKDRKIFKELTQGRILVIGRKTFEEHPTLAHVDHTKVCIVVSNSMHEVKDLPNHAPISIHVVRSFLEALHLAREISESEMEFSKKDDQSLVCWVAGGERIYEQALEHRSVDEVHLSVMDMEVDYRNIENVAMFPARYRWDHKFEIPTRTEYPGDEVSPAFSYFVYKRKQQRKVP